ncbi:MAG: permease [Planctomycetota bacterium]|nr:permease [Planctomycetota bacterium]
MTPLLALLLGLAALALGPLLAGALARRERLRSALDGFILCIVVGLCLAVLMPHALSALGPAAVPLALVGFAVPLLAERWLARHRPGETPGVLYAALAGLLLHEALDGAGLAGGGHGHHHEATTLAILFHRIPVGLLVWWSVEPLLGRRATWGVLALMGAATVAGFVLAHEVEEHLAGGFAGVVNALLAGALLHVVFDHAPERAPAEGGPTASALGGLLGLACWAALPIEASPAARAAAAAFTGLLLDASPALLLGFLGAGLLTLVPGGALTRLMSGTTIFGSAVRGTVFGLPLPVCSCGVVPVYRGLVHKGVPPAAAIAFLVATPELGVDAVMVSVPLLGLELTLARLAAALIVALAAGVVAGLLAGNGQAAAPAAPEPADAGRPSVREAVRYGCVESVDELGPWILAGLLVAGALEPVLRPEWLSAVPPAGQVPLAALIGAPIYVCASAATPVAAMLLAKGLSPGAVIAFLLTGPATNVTTWGALRGSHGRRAAGVIVATVVVSCVAVGLTIDVLGVASAAAAAAGPSHDHGPLSHLAAGAFALLALASFLRLGPRGFLARLGLVHRHGHGPTDPCGDEPGHDHGHDGHGHDGHGHDHAHDHGHEQHDEAPGDGCCDRPRPG